MVTNQTLYPNMYCAEEAYGSKDGRGERAGRMEPAVHVEDMLTFVLPVSSQCNRLLV